MHTSPLKVVAYGHFASSQSKYMYKCFPHKSNKLEGRPLYRLVFKGFKINKT